MPRWLIAVFTLHFLLSVGVSAFGKTPAAVLPPQVCTHAMLLDDASAGPSLQTAEDVTKDASADLRGHGLMDDRQDLPDDQNIRLPQAASGLAPFPCPATLAEALPAPLPKKRHKPPRTGRIQRA